MTGISCRSKQLVVAHIEAGLYILIFIYQVSPYPVLRLFAMFGP